MQRAVIYLRVSGEEQAKKGTSLEDQELVCLRKAADLHAQIVGVFADKGVSGSLYRARPEVQHALEAIENGEANVFLAAKLDRSGRDMEGLRDIRRRVLDAGGDFVLADGLHFENSADGNLMFSNFSALTVWERERIAERTKGGRRRRVEAGKQPCRSKPPFGYRIVCHKDVADKRHTEQELGIYQLIPEDSAIVEQIFTRYARGQSLGSICNHLQREGVPCPRRGENGGKMWYPSTLAFILRNSVYYGRPVNYKDKTIKDEGRVLDKGHGGPGFKRPYRREPTRVEERIALQAPAVVSEELWDRCQERLNKAQKVYSGNPGRKYLLSGLLRCPDCGRGLHGVKSRKRSGLEYRYYKCPMNGPSRNSAGIACNGKHYRAEEAEEALIRGLLVVATTPDLVESAILAFDKSQKRHVSQPDAERLKAELTALEAKEKATVLAQIAGIQAGADASIYTGVFAGLAESKKAIQDELHLYRQNEYQIEEPGTVAQKVATVFQGIEVALTASTLSVVERHSLIANVVDQIIPEGDGFRVELAGYCSDTLQTNQLV